MNQLVIKSREFVQQQLCRASRIAVLTTLLLIAGPAWAQSPEWVHTWGGGGDDRGTSVVVNEAGETFVSGITTSTSSGNEDILLLKFDANGNLVWGRSYDFGTRELIALIRFDNSGNILLCGSTSDNSDALILKIDSNGNVLWAKGWYNSWETAHRPAVDSNDNLYTGGQTINGAIDAWISKYSSGGDRLWTKIWHKNVNDYVKSFALDQSGHLYAGGVTGPWTFPGGHDLIILKYDLEGNLIWDRIWSGSGTEFEPFLICDVVGNVYLTGTTDSFGAGGRDICLMKLDSLGNLLWQRTWGGAADELATSLTMDGLGNILIVGSTLSFTASEDLFILKFDASGSLLAQKTYSGSNTDYAGGVAAIGSNIYISGVSSNNTGTWQTVSGAVSTPAGNFDVGGGTVSTINGTESSLAPLETSFVGVMDLGGGGADVLVTKLKEVGLCGDADGSGIITISDAVFLISFIFSGGPAPTPLLAGDADCSGLVNISDAVYLINYIFAGGPAPCSACP